MTQRAVTSKEQAERLAAYLVAMPLPYQITVREGGNRSLEQNALLHRWYGVIAKHMHESASDVKGRCHREYGLPIRLRDPQFAWLWNNSAGQLPYEKQCKVLASGQFQISSKMTTTELSEYMDAMQREYAAQEIHLTSLKDD